MLTRRGLLAGAASGFGLVAVRLLAGRPAQKRLPAVAGPLPAPAAVGPPDLLRGWEMRVISSVIIMNRVGPILIAKGNAIAAHIVTRKEIGTL